MARQTGVASLSPAPRIADLRAYVLRAPVAVPVQTSFGAMTDRPMVLVRIEDNEGAVGWGEVWCNFPACGAEHRARLLATVFRALLHGHPAEPAATFAALSARTRILALQSGEPGPFAQCIAGIDIALWDLAARRRGCALWQLLDAPGSEIAVYASGLNPDRPEALAAAKHAEGYRAFKLKVGFGLERDCANLRALRDLLGADARIMVDANQAWDLETAVCHARAYASFGLAWLEEPIAADSPWEAWRALRGRIDTPLAAGENLLGHAQFEQALGASVLAVIQPDVAKWGGVTGCLAVARQAHAAGTVYCPHFLGGGVGLVASAHLLAAVGGEGMLEVDSNDNPLRTLLMGPLAMPRSGRVALSSNPGLGIAPDLRALHDYVVLEA
ncbi:MAG TPA: mandelate racemase/muconate lactonizing enzyme family protein [Alphaproteobacteria bacterium]|nr:mandelate racemase/muconate lactonizing enzyme family protein [Alphaproteobacteria bacterium]